MLPSMTERYRKLISILKKQVMAHIYGFEFLNMMFVQRMYLFLFLGSQNSLIDWLNAHPLYGYKKRDVSHFLPHIRNQYLQEVVDTGDSSSQQLMSLPPDNSLLEEAILNQAYTESEKKVKDTKSKKQEMTTALAVLGDMRTNLHILKEIERQAATFGPLRKRITPAISWLEAKTLALSMSSEELVINWADQAKEQASVLLDATTGLGNAIQRLNSMVSIPLAEDPYAFSLTQTTRIPLYNVC